ncbi:tetratricopeptide repeat protein [Persicobacter psychrovividus]|uniref:Tetratricopeptide repeat protein n=1 Tax=Persicobacter psychrovividus TaxID=387638 RepID=A0ABM7VAK7_9BACT|nr:hypothetical protein PEPS_02170 [Persicobacter psychrovividus]
MANNKKKQETEKYAGQELLENPEALADRLSKSERFLEENKVPFIGGAIALIVIVGLFFFFQHHNSQKDLTAQAEMFQAQYYFEQDSLNLALNGDGNSYGFLKIADEYGSTKAGKLATYYTGVIYLRQGKYDEAINELNDFNPSDLLIQARAYALVGDCYMQKKNFGEALSNYEKAANYNENKHFSPMYLLKAAVAAEQANKLESAKANLEKIVNDYSDANEYQEARKQLARVNGMIK